MDDRSTTWPLAKRVGFRFLATYFLLYSLPFPLHILPWLGARLGTWVHTGWQKVAVWVGHHVVGIEGEVFVGPTGSGDTTFDYLRVLIMVVVAVVATIVWSVVDRRRRSYRRAAPWLIAGCSLFLGFVLLGYGFAKIIPSQFSTPSLERLLQTYGSSSPMGLAWTFMGLSPVYTIFAGVMEAIPGALLLFRRTRLLGACLAVAVMSNVVMINVCFDVPVKLYSSHLLLAAGALVLVDARRLATFFLGTRAAPPGDRPPLARSRWIRLATAVVAAWVIVPTVWRGVFGGLESYRTWGAGRPRPAIWGIYDVQTFSAGGEEVPALVTDPVRWQALVVDQALPIRLGTFERPGQIAIQRMNGRLVRYAVGLEENPADASEGTITILPEGQVSVAAAHDAGVSLTDVLHYERPEPGRMIVRGTFEEHRVEITLTERALDDMVLINRGYHWINETPFNR